MGYRETCFKMYWKLESGIAPNLKFSQTIYESALKKCLYENCRWLDLGCGHRLLPPWRYENERQIIGITTNIVGLDYDLYSLKKHKTIQKRIRGDIGDLPFGDGCFDLVTANMVFEHLNDPSIQLKEIYRVLKPGGVLLFHTPNASSYATIFSKLIPDTMRDKLVWHLQKRKEEDVFPAYYKVNSLNNIKMFSIVCGFEVDQIKMICSSAQLVMVPPLVIFELVLIRLLMTHLLKDFRTNIIAKLKKPF